MIYEIPKNAISNLVYFHNTSEQKCFIEGKKVQVCLKSCELSIRNELPLQQKSKSDSDKYHPLDR